MSVWNDPFEEERRPTGRLAGALARLRAELADLYAYRGPVDPVLLLLCIAASALIGVTMFGSRLHPAPPAAAFNLPAAGAAGYRVSPVSGDPTLAARLRVDALSATAPSRLGP